MEEERLKIIKERNKDIIALKLLDNIREKELELIKNVDVVLENSNLYPSITEENVKNVIEFDIKSRTRNVNVEVLKKEIEELKELKKEREIRERLEKNPHFKLAKKIQHMKF